MLSNNISIRSVTALGSLLAFVAVTNAVPLPPQKASGPDLVAKGRQLLAGRSARFVENRGQWKAEARFLAQGRTLNLWYTDRGIRYDHFSADKARHQAVDMFFVGGQDARPVGVSKLNAESRYYHGDVAVTGVRSFREILKRNVEPGVDMRGYFDAGRPRYDLIVAPGTKPSSIGMGFRGTNGLSVQKGALKVGTDFGGFFNAKPIAYQIVDGKQTSVAAAWTVDRAIARIKVGKYDPSKPLVIDPLVYGTYFGGLQGPDEVRAAITDTYNNTNNGLFIVGSSSAPDFPGTSLPFSGTLNPAQGGTDAFVARIPTSGTATDLSIFIGGSGVDVAQYVKQTPTGDIWFAGTTIAGGSRVNGEFNTFPSATNPGTGRRLFLGTDTANAANYFVGRFVHQNGTLSFGEDGTGANRYAVVIGTGVANASTNSAYMTGFDINPLPSNVVQMAISGATNTALSTSLISTPPGVTASQQTGYSYPVDANGNPHRTGFLLRFTADLSGNAFPVTAFDLSRYSSQYVTGTRASELRGVALDRSGNAYTVGTVYDASDGTLSNIDTAQTPSAFYTTPNAIADTNGTTVLGRLLRATDVFVRIYGNYGTLVGQNNVVFSGLYGGNGVEEAGGVAMSLSVTAGGGSAIPIYTGSAIAIDADANIYFTGTTRASANVPYTAGAFFHFVPPPGNEINNSDVFVARLSTGGRRLDYSTQLGALAQNTTLAYGPSQFTSVMPAGIVVDSRGYVSVTGNLRPYSIIWPSTYTAASVFEPTSWTLSTLPLGQAANTIDTTYDTSTQSKYPTTEGFLITLNPSFSTLQFGSYIGGDLDDLVYAPTLDSDGNVIVAGWTDGSRGYTSPNFTTPPEYQDFSGSLPGFISSPTVKSIPDTNGGLTINDFGYNSQRNFPSATAPDQQTIRIAVGRDGYVARVSPNLPAIVNPTIGLAFNPNSIPALGTSVGTVTLNVAQPLATKVRVALTAAVGLSASDYTISGLTADPTGGTPYVTIPSGSTSASFAVKSNTVGNGGSLSFSATIPSGTSTSTSNAGVTIGGLSFSLSLNPMQVVGSAAGTTVTGTILLPSAAPTNLTFNVTVPDNATNRSIFPSGTSISGGLKIASATVASGSVTGTFTFAVGSPPSPQVIVVTATTVTNSTLPNPISATSALTVNPVGLVGISPVKSTIRSGRDQLSLNVVFNGPVSASDAFSLTYGLGGVFPPSTSSNPTVNTTIGALTFVGSSNGQYTYRYTVNSNRVSRSQDVTILATYKGTTASTQVSVVR